ncbi:MAG: cysteine desulfurase [Propionibacteriaceae bacterium]|nr:cysteine desulfurase [Propionibacteriaceae bacterium]
MQHYLDHAATTPMLPVAIDTWQLGAAELGNASSIHASGRNARRIVEESRERIAARLGAHPGEVVFTSGANEADNLAVLGLARARRAVASRMNRVLVSAVEHPAVRSAAAQLATEGFEVVELPVDGRGLLRLDVLCDDIRHAPEQVALLSCMWANNETGAVQPVAEIAAQAAAHAIPYHCDAAQALGFLPVTFAAAAMPGLTAMSISGHKVGGPMGIGALLVRKDAAVAPTSYGGGQERRLRSGTVPVALIASFAAALEEVVTEREHRAARLRKLRDMLADGLRELGAEIVGPTETSHLAPHICYAVFPAVPAETLLLLLDQAGIAASAGSACSAGVVQPSEVLLAMGYSAEQAVSGVRFSLGWTTDADDIDALLQVLPALLERGASR